MKERPIRFSDMLKIQKKDFTLHAYRLGDFDPAIAKLMQEGKIKSNGSGTYEVFSQEAVNGNTNHGETAHDGDYIITDSKGYPFPNTPEYFHKNYRKIKDDLYESLPVVIQAWTYELPMCPEVEFLILHKGLVLNRKDPTHYFNAELYGTLESASADAVLVFYFIDYDENGHIIDASFNFVARDEFDNIYDVIS